MAEPEETLDLAALTEAAVRAAHQPEPAEVIDLPRWGVPAPQDAYFTSIPDYVLSCECLTSSDKIVHGVLYRFALMRGSQKKGYAWPKQKTLAACCKMSTRTLQHHLNRLRDHGLVKWKRRGPKGNEYVFRLHWECPKPGCRIPEEMPGSG